jgi:NSS family neurotransmitter:Na+ symporter
MGLHNVIAAAMNQAFFTLSIGIGSMEIFGSYMSKENTLTTESVRICGLDTFVALMAGLIILPACASFGVDYDKGPSLIFVTLPKVFINMTGGRIFGTLFFLFMTFACFTTIIAVFQNLVAACEEAFGWSKRKASLLNCLFVLVGSLPAIFSYNLWSGVSIFGKSIFDLEDFIVSNLLLPIGALVYLLFCTYKFGWGEENYLLECNTGKGIKMSSRLRPYFRYVLPVLILIILVFGLIP